MHWTTKTLVYDMSLLSSNCVMFVYIACNLVSLCFFFSLFRYHSCWIKDFQRRSRLYYPENQKKIIQPIRTTLTRSSADADNRLDASSGQSRSTNMVPFHMLHIVSYCAIVTLSLRRAVFTIFVFKNFMTLKWGSKVTQGHWEWYHSIDCVWFPISVL